MKNFISGLLTAVIMVASIGIIPLGAEMPDSTTDFEVSMLQRELLLEITKRASLSYEEYFKNEHGFYFPEVEKSNKSNYFNEMVQALNKSDLNKTMNQIYPKAKLKAFIGNEEIAFFAVENKLYRYHYYSNTLEEVFENDSIIEYYPITNETLLWRKSSDSKTIKSEIVCIEEINSDYTYYLYDIRTDENILVKDAAFLFNLTAQVTYTHLSVFNATINGKNIAHASYPIGSKALSAYGGGQTCSAFGRYIFDYIWGFSESIFGTYNGYKYTRNATGQNMTNILDSISIGSYVRFHIKDSIYDHSMILVRRDVDYVFYHSNLDLNNTVYITLYPRAAIELAFDKLLYTVEK